MKMYQVTDIEFDFVDSEGELSKDIQADILDDVLGTICLLYTSDAADE